MKPKSLELVLAESEEAWNKNYPEPTEADKERKVYWTLGWLKSSYTSLFYIAEILYNEQQ